jgi:glutaminyl-tRNA synthetase
VLAEPAILTASENERFQFLRKGYFVLDKDSTKDKLVFNRTVTLNDVWAKEAKKE